MSCKNLLFVAALGAALFASQARAGGPPWLCVPVDGVTKGNAAECTKLLAAKLGDKQFKHDQLPEMMALERGGQWYVGFYIHDDVRLSDIDAALKGSAFSTPHDRIRVFGHAVLEIDAKASAAKELQADLAKLDHVTVVESKPEGEFLLVTVAMPYPANEDREYWAPAGWAAFNRTMEETDHASIDANPTTAEKLPSYQAFCDVAARHKATVTDVRWSTTYSCRPVGTVAVPKDDATVAATAR